LEGPADLFSTQQSTPGNPPHRRREVKSTCIRSSLHELLKFTSRGKPEKTIRPGADNSAARPHVGPDLATPGHDRKNKMKPTGRPSALTSNGRGGNYGMSRGCADTSRRWRTWVTKIRPRRWSQSSCWRESWKI